jgi:glutamate-ammonia-ligase adenylyltransferase
MVAVLDTLPEELREAVGHWLERFGDSGKTDVLVRLVACSEFAGTVSLREKNWLLENMASFELAPDPQRLEMFVADVASSDADIAEIQSRLRRFRNRYMLHVLWREIFALANLDETLNSLSSLADRLLDAASRYSSKVLAARYGTVRTADGSEVPPVILGMGKLGGYELNFSSDVDIIFLYPEAGETDGARRISAQEYFGRWSRQVIALLDETTADGFVFRMDTRLRPFGDSGPPVVSFGALESYLLQHGRDWERYAYVKARIVGPQPGDEVAHELYRNMIKPFVYRRYIDFGVFESLREMHAMIAAEVQSRELQDNIKLGPGGIREAEFIVQSLQLVRGGREPQLQSREYAQRTDFCGASRILFKPCAIVRLTICLRQTSTVCVCALPWVIATGKTCVPISNRIAPLSRINSRILHFVRARRKRRSINRSNRPGNQVQMKVPGLHSSSPRA